MSPTRLVMSFSWAIETASICTMVPNKTIYMCHSRSISSSKGKQWVVNEETIVLGIPDRKTLQLESSKVVETRENVGVNNLWLIWPRNKSSWKNSLFLVS